MVFVCTVVAVAVAVAGGGRGVLACVLVCLLACLLALWVMSLNCGGGEGGCRVVLRFLGEKGWSGGCFCCLLLLLLLWPLLAVAVVRLLACLCVCWRACLRFGWCPLAVAGGKGDIK